MLPITCRALPHSFVDTERTVASTLNNLRSPKIQWKLLRCIEVNSVIYSLNLIMKAVAKKHVPIQKNSSFYSVQFYRGLDKAHAHWSGQSTLPSPLINVTQKNKQKNQTYQEIICSWTKGSFCGQVKLTH